MTFYLIKSGQTRADLAVFTFSNEASANRATETRFADYPTRIVETASDFVTNPRGGASGPELVALYNALIAEGTAPVERFKTRDAGAERVFALLEAKYKDQPVESEAASFEGEEAAANDETETQESEVAAKKAKVKKPAKAKKAKAEKKPRAAKVKGEKKPYQAEVNSSGGEASKATALELMQRPNGATVERIATKLGVSEGTAKNLIWYLRRDGKKIELNREKKSYHA